MSGRQRLLTILAVGVVTLAAGSAMAQVPVREYAPIYSPGVSPYLGLTNRQTGVTPNYYLYVKPQVDAYQNAATNQARIQQLQQQMNAAAGQQTGPTVFRTGHQTTFGNYSHFYPGLKPAGVVTPARR